MTFILVLNNYEGFSLLNSTRIIEGFAPPCGQ